MLVLRYPRRFVLLLILIGGATLLVSLWRLCDRDDQINFLAHHAPAEWVLCPRLPELGTHPIAESHALFRRSFTVGQTPSSALLFVRAFKRCAITLNGAALTIPSDAEQNWKQPLEFNVTQWLKPGTNEILVTVFNSAAMPALWLSLRADGLALDSDENWDSSFGGILWRPARLASRPSLDRPATFGNTRPLASLRARASEILLFAALSACIAFGANELLKRRFAVAANLPFNALIGAILLWIIIFANNLPLLPSTLGYDAKGHQDYINFIQEHNALPLANNGWEMYQPPLYYFLAAQTLNLAGLSLATPSGLVCVRGLGLLIGIAQLVLVFLCLRLLFPESPRRQLFGLLLAAFLPAHLLFSQFITNEMLAALFVTAAIWLMLRRLRDPQPALWLSAAMGACLGASLLTKSSALVLVPIFLATLAGKLWSSRGRHPLAWLRELGDVCGMIALVCGWHYWRVALKFKNPFIGNWDAVSGFSWWQDPGFRTTAYYTRFGAMFVHPFFSSFKSFLDGIYSTVWGDGSCSGTSIFGPSLPWHSDLMAAGYLFALVPVVVLLVGTALAVARFFRRPTLEWFFLLGILGAGVFLLFYMSLRVPAWSSVKGVYALLALLPFCAVGAVGWEFLTRRSKPVHLALCVLLGLWAVNSYATLWIGRQRAETWLACGIASGDSGHSQDAIAQLLHAAQLDPQNAEAKSWLGLAYFSLGQTDDAQKNYTAALNLNPADPKTEFRLGMLMDAGGDTAQTIAHFRAAIKYDPDYADPMNRLAWILATRPDPTFRDGPESVRLAQRSCELTWYHDAKMLNTLAAAYAETGQFDLAQQTARQAMDLARSQSKNDIADTAAGLLKLFQSGRPYHNDAPLIP